MIPSIDIANVRKQLIEYILNGDRNEAIELLDKQAERFHWRETINELLEPVLDDMENVGPLKRSVWLRGIWQAR